MSLQVNSENVGDVTVLACTGEVDLGNAPQLREALASVFNEAKPRLLLDLSGVGFMDSTGIGIMVNALNLVREKNGACAFCGLQPRVHRILQIAGLLNALPLHDTRAGALLTLSGNTKNGARNTGDKSASEKGAGDNLSKTRLASDAS
ncbi:MAG TPA: STAS domain-containing protein [Abditibacteriaceae bacterium]|jgi:anti-anti-sigma factor